MLYSRPIWWMAAKLISLFWGVINVGPKSCVYTLKENKNQWVCWLEDLLIGRFQRCCRCYIEVQSHLMGVVYLFLLLRGYRYLRWLEALLFFVSFWIPDPFHNTKCYFIKEKSTYVVFFYLIAKNIGILFFVFYLNGFCFWWNI